jgi:hypothetical protein
MYTIARNSEETFTLSRNCRLEAGNVERGHVPLSGPGTGIFQE